MRALREHGVALTIGDHPERPFQTHDATADWRFVRFHYGSRGRGGNYSATELEQWARRIAQWRRRQDGVGLLQQRLARASRPPTPRCWPAGWGSRRTGG